MKKRTIVVVGAGPAGLMAAEVMAPFAQVKVFDAMPTAARKFLMAGVGGMNITHSEPFDLFVARYREAAPWLRPLLEQFGAEALRDWIHQLGIETFVGTSGRVFPKEMKAAPLLRAWLLRLKHQRVEFFMRHQWLGWHEHQLQFKTADNIVNIECDACVFAMGGGSWPQLGSDGRWCDLFQKKGIVVHDLKPSNCGFQVNWSAFFSAKFAGVPLKPVAISFDDEWGKSSPLQGEFVITKSGIEGSLIYAVSADIRQQLTQRSQVTVFLDLLPHYSFQKIQSELNTPRERRSLSSFLERRLGLKGVKVALLHEVLTSEQLQNKELLARTLKQFPLTITACGSLVDAISSAGGVALNQFDQHLMLKQHPGIFCAGEMLDWEAPTGGYLLTACFATGHAAGLGVKNFLNL